MSDSNAYSVRIAGEDLGLRYALRIRSRSDDAVLVATPLRRDSDLPELELGRTYGPIDGFAKIYLNPAWRLARRSYQGRTLGHVYLTSDYSIDQLQYITGEANLPTATIVPNEPEETAVPLDVPAWGDPIEPSEQPTRTRNRTPNRNKPR
jgi:N-acetylmuramoyl-L-alanine amidase